MDHTEHIQTAIKNRVNQYSDWLTGGNVGLIFPAVAENLLFVTTVSRLTLGPTQPLIRWAPGAISHGVKWSRREGNSN
jgi:hypothetical protein